MKNLFTYAMLFMSMCLFTACPSDDDDDVPAYNSSSVSRKLWGEWSRSINNGTTRLFFWDNGKMFYSHTNQSASSDHVWSYNETTGILATTANNLQWEVTLCDSTVWTGIALSGNKGTVTFTRSPLFAVMVILTTRTWVSSIDNSEWDSNGSYNSSWLELSNGKTDFFIIPNDLVKIEESILQDKLFIREYSSRSYSSETVVYECIIDHPYSYDNVRVSCKWVPNYDKISDFGTGYHSNFELRPKK